MEALKRVNTIAKHVAGPAQAVAKFTVEDLVAKREEGQVWIAIKNKVYDVTDFLDDHPGGVELITDIPADNVKQMTTEFDDAEHSEEAMEQLVPLFRGILVSSSDDGAETMEEEGEEEELAEVPTETPYTPTPFALQTAMKLVLDSKEHLSHDVTVYRFALPKRADEFSLPIGKHIVLSYEEMDGKHVSRAYTPVSPQRECGFVDFLIKSYPGGKMSEHLKTLRPQVDGVQMLGPKGKLSYLGQGRFRIRRAGVEEDHVLDHVGMVAGGSGITPMFQIIQAVAQNANDALRITLLFGNKTEEDMILRHALDALQALKRRGQIEIVYALDVPPTHPGKFVGEIGFITKQMLSKYMPKPGPKSMVFLCGPPPMINRACLPALKELGYEKDRIFKF